MSGQRAVTAFAVSSSRNHGGGGQSRRLEPFWWRMRRVQPAPIAGITGDVVDEIAGAGFVWRYFLFPIFRWCLLPAPPR